MFLHIGGTKTVPVKNIIGIFDLRIREKPVNKQFLEMIDRDIDISGDNLNKYKSFILTSNKVYFSLIASLTLKKRFLKNEKLNTINNSVK